MVSKAKTGVQFNKETNEVSYFMEEPFCTNFNKLQKELRDYDQKYYPEIFTPEINPFKR